MKSKDVVLLVVAILIFGVTGMLIYTQLMPKKSTASQGVQVEVVGSIPSAFDPADLSQLSSSQVKDFDSPVDLSGLNNSAPFGQ